MGDGVAAGRAEADFWEGVGKERVKSRLQPARLGEREGGKPPFEPPVWIFYTHALELGGSWVWIFRGRSGSRGLICLFGV